MEFSKKLSFPKILPYDEAWYAIAAAGCCGIYYLKLIG